jgi:hypothetical protein
MDLVALAAGLTVFFNLLSLGFVVYYNRRDVRQAAPPWTYPAAGLSSILGPAFAAITALVLVVHTISASLV